MESLVKYAKKVRKVYEKYVKNNGIDDLAEKVYNSFQNIKDLSDDDKNILDEFISNYSSFGKHLADVVYLNEEASTFRNLSKMRPIKLSKTDGRIYEARNNSFNFVLEKSYRKPVKVYQRKSFK